MNLDLVLDKMEKRRADADRTIACLVRFLDLLVQFVRGTAKRAASRRRGPLARHARALPPQA